MNCLPSFLFWFLSALAIDDFKSQPFGGSCLERSSKHRLPPPEQQRFGQASHRRSKHRLSIKAAHTILVCARLTLLARLLARRIRTLVAIKIKQICQIKCPPKNVSVPAADRSPPASDYRRSWPKINYSNGGTLRSPNKQINTVPSRFSLIIFEAMPPRKTFFAPSHLPCMQFDS